MKKPAIFIDAFISDKEKKKWFDYKNHGKKIQDSWNKKLLNEDGIIVIKNLLTKEEISILNFR
jgi:uncharacterized Zn ribbon protein